MLAWLDASWWVVLLGGVVGGAALATGPGSAPRDAKGDAEEGWWGVCVDAASACAATVEWWAALWAWGWRGEALEGSTRFVTAPACARGEVDWTERARAHTYSLAQVGRLWERAHYRSGTFGADLRKNLRNVAFPGTGVPLSLVAAHPAVYYAAYVALGPLVSLVAAAGTARGAGSWQRWAREVLRRYVVELVAPTTWFALWQLNCRLATWHALATGDAGYALEDKLAMLEAAEAAGLPVSPWLVTDALICKQRNEEGGLGYAAFSSATSGGAWIVQPRLRNHAAIAGLLPADAPLSTLRIVTGAPREGGGEPRALSCVFRAGMSGAATDHSSILFDVDLRSGRVRCGTTNAHWYRLGARAIGQGPWEVLQDVRNHPDTGTQLEGVLLPGVARARQLCELAHARLCPKVPLVGWDVAFTAPPVASLRGSMRAGRISPERPDSPTLLPSTASHPHPAHADDSPPLHLCLLEGNFSCNFFRGTLDTAFYYRFVLDHFLHLESRRALA
jgi:hypothetical protein